MARIANVQRLIGCLYTPWYYYIPTCRFHGTATPLVTCLSGALDGHYPESLPGGWLAVFIWILGFDHHRLTIVDFRDVGLLDV
jgi:hypothetical protein